MTKLDLNKYPYFDSFDANNQYYRTLFKPTVAVQARELTGLQSTLQDQIAKFGDWAFQNGDIVSGCSITDLPNVPYVYLQDLAANGLPFDYTKLVNTVVSSTTSNLSARVLLSNTGTVQGYPNTNIVYLQYLNTGNNGATVFQPNETLAFNTIIKTGNATLDNVAVINSFANVGMINTFSTGNAHGISVSGGVVYLDGTFVTVINPTFGIINAYGLDAANAVVGFEAQESIVNFLQDPSLCDNSQGFTNLNAPGADRLKIQPILISYQQNEAPNTNFNPIARYNFNSLVTKATQSSNLYSIVGDAIADIVYKTEGNYVTNPFVVSTFTTLPGNTSSSLTANIIANNFLGCVSSGTGFCLGHEVELLRPTYIQERRGIDTLTKTSQQITFNYGNYFVLSEVAGSFTQFSNASTVSLYDTPQQAVTNKTFTSLAPTGNNIGTACVRCFSFNSGTPGTNTALYLLHVYNLQMSNGQVSTAQIKSIYSSSPSVVADVAIPGLRQASNPNLLWNFGVSGLKTLNSPNATEFVYLASASATMGTNGSIGIALGSPPPGGTNILPFGTGILPAQDLTDFSVIVTSNTVGNASLHTGTVTVYSTNTLILGSGTNFISAFQPGDVVQINGSTLKTIVSVANNTNMQVDSASVANASAQSYVKFYPAGKLLPLNTNFGGPTGYINIVNSLNFSVITTEGPNAAMPVTVIYPVLRTSAQPGQKQINKNRYVKINTANNIGGINGPWCLGFPDIHQVTAIYGSSSNSFTQTSPNLLGNGLVFGTGGTEQYYGYGYVYNDGSYNQNQYPWLLVQLDYFSSNVTSAYGFFSIDSYPIDDANTANTTAIQTATIPVYTDSQGSQMYLRDYIDFRVPSTPSANDTGYCNTANTSDFTTRIGYSSINPTRTISFQVPGTGLLAPAYGQNFQSNYTIYLPRQDLILITPNSTLKIKEGVSSITPQPPLFPENAMALAQVNIPPYPSLTSDQQNAIYATNKLCHSICRNTKSYITCSLVTNRNYTMKNIGQLDQRITNLEYYTGLNLLQQTAQNINVVDANGLNAFKNGIFADPCSSFAYCDVSNPQFSIAIDSSLSQARPQFQREVIDIYFNANNSPTVEATGRCITLPYSEIPFIIQPYATGYRSAALVNFAWNGTCVLIPPYDNWQDVVNSGSINITINNLTAWEQFASSPAGMTWGDWVTTSSTTSVVNTISSSGGTGSTINVAPIQIGTWTVYDYFSSHNSSNPGGTYGLLGTTKQLSSSALSYVWTTLNTRGYSQNSYSLGTITFDYGEANFEQIFGANGQLISNGTISGS